MWGFRRNVHKCSSCKTQNGCPAARYTSQKWKMEHVLQAGCTWCRVRVQVESKTLQEKVNSSTSLGDTRTTDRRQRAINKRDHVAKRRQERAAQKRLEKEEMKRQEELEREREILRLEQEELDRFGRLFASNETRARPGF